MTTPPTTTPQIPKETHLHYLRQTIALAKQSPPKPTNFRVGCVIVSYPTTPEPPSSETGGKVLSTGYTLELPGNTHAEQCALSKLLSADDSSTPTTLFPPSRTRAVYLYTSLEPCSVRLSGNAPCVERIIATRGADGGGIARVVFGAKEPGTFVRDSQSCRVLDDAGVDWEYIDDLEAEILSVAMEGHRDATATSEQKKKKDEEGRQQRGTRIDDITPEERKRQEALPRNPKKRMMEVPPPPKS